MGPAYCLLRHPRRVQYCCGVTLGFGIIVDPFRLLNDGTQSSNNTVAVSRLLYAGK